MKEWDVTGKNGENSIKFTPFSTIAPSQFVQTAARLEFLQFFPARAPANPQLYVNIADLYKNFPRGHTHRPGHIPGGPHHFILSAGSINTGFMPLRITYPFLFCRFFLNMPIEHCRKYEPCQGHAGHKYKGMMKT